MLFLPAQHIGRVGTCRESQDAALLPWGGPHKGVMGGEDDPRGVSLGGLASALKPSKVWRRASGRMEMSFRRINLVVQKPGGGEATGPLCLDQAL